MVTPEQALAEISGLFGSIKRMGRSVSRGVKKAGRIAKKTVKSPILKAGVAGLAVAFPPVGVPAASALVTANAVVSNLESADRKRRELAKRLAANTAKAAKAGDVDSKRGLALLLVAKRMRIAQRDATKKWLAIQRAKSPKPKPPAPRRPRIRVVKPKPKPSRARSRTADDRRRRLRPRKRATPRVVAIRGVVVTANRRCLPGKWVRARKGHHAGLLVTKSGRCFRGVWRKVV
jgi:hypothetical protein